MNTQLQSIINKCCRYFLYVGNRLASTSQVYSSASFHNLCSCEIGGEKALFHQLHVYDEHMETGVSRHKKLTRIYYNTIQQTRGRQEMVYQYELALLEYDPLSQYAFFSQQSNNECDRSFTIKHSNKNTSSRPWHVLLFTYEKESSGVSAVLSYERIEKSE